MSAPIITAIHIAPGSRLPMKAVESVVADAGKGLIGDRYHGTRHRHVSVQSATSLEEASARFQAAIPAEGTRRNLTLSYGVVPFKPGVRLTIGGVELEVVRIAAPCRLLDDVLGKGAAHALHQRAGSVCRILVGGEIRLGDQVFWDPSWQEPEVDTSL